MICGELWVASFAEEDLLLLIYLGGFKRRKNCKVLCRCCIWVAKNHEILMIFCF